MKKKIWIILSILFVVAIFYVMIQGKQREILFSPETFQSRIRWGYNIPGTDISLVRFETATDHPQLVKYWIQEGYLSNLKSKSEIWDFIIVYQGSQRSWGGHAKGFWFYIDSAPENPYWVEWSKKHPTVAKRIWPMVITCIKATTKSDRHKILYSHAYDLLFRTYYLKSDAELHKMVDEWKAEVEKRFPDLRLSR